MSRKPPTPAKVKPDPDQFIWGATEIGALIGREPPQVWYAVKKGYLDVDHFGRLLRSTPRRLGLVPKAGAS
jgi:hypothetical protein